MIYFVFLLLSDARLVGRTFDIGDYKTCVVLSDNRGAKCWGMGADGQLAHGDSRNLGASPDTVPLRLPRIDLGGDVAYISAGYKHTCALLKPGRVRCWGIGLSGRLGYGTENSLGDTPGTVPSAVGDVPLGNLVVEEVAAGTATTCVLHSGGKVRCWGLGYMGSLGLGSETSYGATPTTLPSVTPDVDVGARVLSIVVSAHTCALVAVTGVSQGGALRCWGPNDEGQCGYGHVRPIGATRDSVPRLVGDVPIGDFVRQVDVGLYHTCVVTLQYTLRCWGSNIYGQLGYGRAGNVGETPETTPARVGDVPMPHGLKVLRVATGAWHTCVLLSDHNVRCWGRGHGLTGPAGAIGYGDEATRGEKGYVNVAPRDLPPIPLGAGVRVGAVRCGRAHTCVLLLDDASASHDDPNAHGRIQCWGWGLFGALGYGNPQSIGDTPARLPERFGPVRVEAVRADPSLVTDAASELAGLAPMRDGWPLDVAGDSIISRIYLVLPIALVVALALYVAVRVARGDSLARIFTQRRSQSKFE